MRELAGMRVLRLDRLQVGKHAKTVQKVVDAIARDDWRSADVKKLSDGVYYRAKLDYENRLLLRFARHEGEACCFVVDLIEGHAYERSPFLRGIKLDLTQLAASDASPQTSDAALPALQYESARYLHPTGKTFHYLDRPLSFDDAQEAALAQSAPLLLLGSAGSGKTAVSLLRLRRETGSIAYVTQSAYLAEASRALYHQAHIGAEDDSVEFFAFRDVLAAVAAPSGRAVRLADFRPFFERNRQKVKFADAHRTFEEFRGVIGAQPEGPLTRAAYLERGVRESIFRAEERGPIWDLFQTYRTWLQESNLYDTNLVAHALQSAQTPKWDFVLVDEVQDFTNVELAFVLAGLRKKGQFALTGDANQIVHPNFFSWANLRSMFFREATALPGAPDATESAGAAAPIARAAAAEVHILPANYRNARSIVLAANRLLALKKFRFGSVDRETDALAEPRASEPGRVLAYPSTDANIRALDLATRRSTKACVLVLRDEDRAEARKRYGTPLVFAIHEAKGLEYDTVILHELVTGARAELNEVCAGASAADLDAERSYARGKDKRDKSLEVYKFFTNALFVALTRGISTVVLVEKDHAHKLFVLLKIPIQLAAVDLARDEGSLEDWQREARRLELQGKADQADAIRKEILRLAPVPWPVLAQAQKRELEHKAIHQGEVFKKAKQQLWDVATFYSDVPLARRLESKLGYAPNKPFAQACAEAETRNHPAAYASARFSEIQQLVNRHGVDYRTHMNLTPLMHAAFAGNVALTRDLVARGANLLLGDNYGNTALHWLLLRGVTPASRVLEREDAPVVPDCVFLQGDFRELYPLLAPALHSLEIDGKLVQVSREQGEYFVFQMIAAFARRLLFRCTQAPRVFVQATQLEEYLGAIPEQVLPERRRARTYLNAVLARSEAASAYATSRKLWVRVRHGHYTLNPAAFVRAGEGEKIAFGDAFGINQAALHIVDSTPDSARMLAPATASAPASAPVAERTPPKQKRATEAKQPAAPPPTMMPFDYPTALSARAEFVGLAGAGPAYDQAAYDADVAALLTPPEASSFADPQARLMAGARLYDHAIVYMESALQTRLAKLELAVTPSTYEPESARVRRLQPNRAEFGAATQAQMAGIVARAKLAPVDRFGLTPLHVAAELRNPSLVSALLAAGADPNARDFYGATAWDRVLMSYRMEAHVPGCSAPLLELLGPAEIKILHLSEPRVLVRGSDGYGIFALACAMARQTLSNAKRNVWGVPIAALAEAAKYFGTALFPPAVARPDYITRTVHHFAGTTTHCLFRSSGGEIQIAAHVEVFVNEQVGYVAPRNLYRLPSIERLRK